MKTSSQLRSGYLDFFVKNGHTLKASAPIVPQGDATLMFNSAGMVPFKPYYLGLKTDLKRATSSQKCFRTTDIERVGTTLRHMTFFEMLGTLAVGLASVLFSMILGVGLGLLAGYVGGKVDAFIMRVADIQLSFPAILIALLIDGVARVALPREAHDQIAIYVLILAIGVSGWVQYARTVRGSTLVERSKEYVQAARVIGRSQASIMFRHVLPNVMGPVLVIATIHIATAIITEATLSFLGVGVPATQPSLGTLIRVGNDFLLSGEWWITVFPGLALIVLVLSVNLLGDWLRDALNPKLR